MKNKDKRMTLKDVLQHPWVTKYSKDVREMRRNSLPGTAFKMFSHAQPNSPMIVKEVEKRGTDDFGGY
jgi:hypothetical protein